MWTTIRPKMRLKKKRKFNYRKIHISLKKKIAKDKKSQDKFLKIIQIRKMKNHIFNSNLKRNNKVSLNLIHNVSLIRMLKVMKKNQVKNKNNVSQFRWKRLIKVTQAKKLKKTNFKMIKSKKEKNKLSLLTSKKS